MPNKKHILFISSWYPNRNNPTHGIFNRYFAEAVALYNKVSVLHVCSEDHLKTEFEVIESNEETIYTVYVYYRKVSNRVPLYSQLLKWKRYIAATELGFSKIKEHSGLPNLIHLNVVLPAGIAVLNLSTKHKLPYVVNENWSGYCEEDGNYKTKQQTYFTKKIIAGASAILPTSTFLREAMQGHGLKGNYSVIPNVVNVHQFTPSLKSQSTLTRFIHISSLTEREKNVSGILKAFARALKINSALELNIVGEGENKEYLIQLSSQLGIQNNVNFKGRLVSNDLVNEINQNDALLMFSYFETFCLVIIEAFACGKPVVTSSAGAIKSYMKKELGLMVPPANEEALAQAIVHFSNSKEDYDSNYIRNFAVKNYSYEIVGQQLNEIYNKVLNT